MLFYNNMGRNGEGRNPYWLAAGMEAGGEILWSQPEIVLFDRFACSRLPVVSLHANTDIMPTGTIRFLKQAGTPTSWSSQTQQLQSWKRTRRSAACTRSMQRHWQVHNSQSSLCPLSHLSRRCNVGSSDSLVRFKYLADMRTLTKGMATGLFSQHNLSAPAANPAAVFGDKGKRVTMPELPTFATVHVAQQGFSIELTLRGHSFARPGDVLFDSRDAASGRGVLLSVSKVTDNSLVRWTCTHYALARNIYLGKTLT
jgi:hypothetical protein